MENGIFNHVISDNVSGSGSIVNQLQEALLRLATGGEPINLQALYTELKQFREHFPQFGILVHFLKSFDDTFHGHAEIKNDNLVNFVLNYREKWDNVQKKVIQSFCDEVGLSGKTVLLHSNSSTIHQLFKNNFTQNPLIYQTLSSPANEGIIQAKVLSKMGFKVQLFHEDALSKYISHIDFAILGADLILNDIFLNKIGSFSIALLCNYFNKSVYVLADRRKKLEMKEISREDLQLFKHEQPKPANEITVENIEGVRVLNEYFEFIPLNLIDKVFL